MNEFISNVTITENVTLITLINIPITGGTISKVFSALADYNVNVDMISQTSPLKGVVNLSFTISDSDLFSAIQALKEFKKIAPDLRIEVNSNNTKISLYGEAMRDAIGIAAQTLTLFYENKIDIIMITTSEVDISYLIYACDQEAAISLLSMFIDYKV